MALDYLKDLNPAQRQVVETTAGPVLVLAGAGSGKTRALTHRIVHILRTNLAQPENVLAVTFTNKAAHEMRERVRHLLAGQFDAPAAISTFHSLGAKILREQYRLTSRPISFTILDAKDSERLIKHALSELGLSSKQWPLRPLRERLSAAKNQGLAPADLAASAGTEIEDVAARVYERYQKLLLKHGSYDFDDLLLEPIKLLSVHAAPRAYYRQLWHYVSVDEYQDTSPIQEQLLDLLVNDSRNLCVVGDDYQAIYSWRGARVDHILNFEKKHPGCATIYLTQNYRSTSAILNGANKVIADNKFQKHKQLWTDKEAGSPITLLEFWHDRDEAGFVRRLIEQRVQSGSSLQDFAILYRTNAQSRLFEEEFLRHRLPYAIVGGLRFYERAEIKDALAFAQLAVNPRSRLALTRLAEILAPGVGPKTAAKLFTSDNSDFSLLKTMADRAILTNRQIASLRPLAQALELAARQPELPPDKLLEKMLSISGYLRHLKQRPDGADRLENIGELYNVAANYVSLTKLVEETSLLTSLDDADVRRDCVWCLTLHAAKGLEFNNVFLVGCEEGLLPHRGSINSEQDLEEERRLLYVGMTRARENLFLTHTRERSLYGEASFQAPSRFLKAIEDDVQRLSPEEPAGSEAPSPEAVPNISYEAGDALKHPIFGRGVVIEAGDNYVTAVFEGFGMKTLTLDHNYD